MQLIRNTLLALAGTIVLANPAIAQQAQVETQPLQVEVEQQLNLVRENIRNLDLAVEVKQALIASSNHVQNGKLLVKTNSVSRGDLISD